METGSVFQKLKYLFLSFVLIGMSISSIFSAYEVIKRGSRLTKARKELESLKLEKDRLLKRLEYVKSEEFIEEEARNKLNMIKPGEEVYLRPKIIGDELIDKYNEGGGNVLGESQSRNLEQKNSILRLIDKVKGILLR